MTCKSTTVLVTVRYPGMGLERTKKPVRPSAMERFDGLRPARLKVGIISAGRVGTALGVALQRADHVVVACSAISCVPAARAAPAA